MRIVVKALLPGTPEDVAAEAQNLSRQVQVAVPADFDVTSSTFGLEELCPACRAPVPLADITTAACPNGHVWGMSLFLSMFPCVCPVMLIALSLFISLPPSFHLSSLTSHLNISFYGSSWSYTRIRQSTCHTTHDGDWNGMEHEQTGPQFTFTNTPTPHPHILFLRSQHAAQSPRSSSRRRWCERALGAAARRSSRLPSPLLVEVPVLVRVRKLRRGSHQLRGAGLLKSFCMPFGGASSAVTVSLRSSNYLGAVARCNVRCA